MSEAENVAHAGIASPVLSASHCAAAVRWLADYQPPEPTLLSGREVDTSAANAAALVALLKSKATRKAREERRCQMPRPLAAWFGRQLSASLFRGCLPPRLVREAMTACRDAATVKRAGRPRLDRDEVELRQLWEAGALGYDDRNFRKLVQAARAQRAQQEQVDRLVSAAGLLTFGEPLVEIPRRKRRSSISPE